MPPVTKTLGRVAVVNKGSFNPSGEPYSKLDEVYGSNGTITGSFRSLVNNNNQPLTNTSAWQLVSKDGAKGDKGDEGDQGPAGANGTAVISPWVDGNYSPGAGTSHNAIYWVTDVGATTGQEPGVSPVWRIDVGNSFNVGDVSFDGENMIYPSGEIEFDHTEDLNTWGTFVGATIVAGVATMTYSSGPEHQLIYKDGIFEAGRKVELAINVLSSTGRCILIVDDSSGFFVDVDLVVGMNKVQFDHAGRTDTTVIIRQEDPGQTKVDQVSVSYVTDFIKIPLNINSTPANNYFLSKADWPVATAFGTSALTKGETLEISQPTAAAILASGVKFNKYTLNENAETSLIYEEVTASSFAFGFNSINLAGYNHYVFVGFGSGNLQIRTKLYNADIPTTGTYVLGDRMKLSIRRDGLKYRFSVYNLTRGWSQSETIQCTPLGTPFFAHNTSNISISMLSGSISVFDSTHLCFSKGMIEKALVGDSITFGQAAITQADRWASKVNGRNQVFGGGADGIAEVKYLLEELLFLKPKQALIMLTGNDYLFGRNPAADYYSFRNNLVNAGIEVVHLLPTPRAYASNVIGMILGGADLRNDIKIDCNTPLQQTPGDTEVLATIYDGGDGLHPNNAGMQVVANTVNENI